MKFPSTTSASSKGWQGIIGGLIAWLIFAPAMPGLAQTRQELEERRKRLQREISMTTSMLEKTSREKAATLDRYMTLQKQIERRERLIQTLSAEIAAAEAAIVRNIAVVESLTSDIVALRADYARAVRQAYRRKTLTNPLLYLLSADNLNQAFRRWLFLRKYDRYRKAQAEAIAQTQQALQHRTAILENARRQQSELLASLQQQRQTLGAELEEKQQLLKTIKANEERLRADLKRQQQNHEALNAAIERIILEEVRKQAAKKEEEETASVAAIPSGSSAAALEREVAYKEDAVTISFRQNRGRLPWPVQSGFVTRRFGRQKHPTLPQVELDNKGIDIRTSENAAVKVVYDGIISGVQYVPGHENTVIIQHGDFYTVYSNLVEVSVAKGGRVKAGQTIGRVGTSPLSNASDLHFEVWHKNQRLNPSLWLKPQ